MRHCSILAVLLLVVSSAASWAAEPGVRSPQQPPPIQVNVRLVNVFVNVTNKYGAPVSGLTQKDFVLSEDGRPQAIAYFEQQTDVPLSMVLAIDTSGSTRKDLPLEKAAARTFVGSMLRPVDRLELMDFNSEVREVVPFTASVRRINDGLNDLDVGPATALYQAIYQASQDLGQRRGRKVLVVISDGGNNAVSSVDYPQALEAARRGQVMVFSIIDLPIMADAGRDEDGEHAMITMSEETGGQYFYANAGDLREAFAKVSEALRTQYLLGYYPGTGDEERGSKEADYRKISVKLTHLKGEDGPYSVANRTGYYPDSTN